MLRRFALVSSILGAIACGALESSLPPDWRLPTEEELVDQPLRADSPSRLTRAVADFNGDGDLDEALLAKSTAFSGEGLLVRLSCGDKCVQWMTLATIDWGPEYPAVSLSMGVEAPLSQGGRPSWSFSVDAA
jgi:hypothetical protein